MVKKVCRVLPKQQQLMPQIKKFSAQVKILSIYEKFISQLGEIMRKVRYLNTAGKSGYFLLNTYQKPDILPKLDIGGMRNILLVSGYKHSFFSRFV